VKKESLDKAFTRYKLSDGKETAYGYGWRIGNKDSQSNFETRWQRNCCEKDKVIIILNELKIKG